MSSMNKFEGRGRKPIISRAKPFYYLATPYRNYPGGTDAAERMARGAAVLFMEAGIPCYAPIAYGAPIAREYNILNGPNAETQEQRDFWLEHDRAMVEAAKSLIVWKAEGWDRSEGMALEIGWAKRLKKYILYADPDDPSDIVHYLAANYPRRQGSTLYRRRKVALLACQALREGVIQLRDWRRIIRDGKYDTYEMDELFS
jgi:hypothetical protein